MSKDYVPKKAGNLSLERSLYLRILHTIRDYPRMAARVDKVIYEGAGELFDKGSGAKTEFYKEAFEAARKTVDAIDNALEKIPIEYRQGIFDNIVYKIKCPDYASKNTWSLWRVRFIYFTAVNLNLA